MTENRAVWNSLHFPDDDTLLHDAKSANAERFDYMVQDVGGFKPFQIRTNMSPQHEPISYLTLVLLVIMVNYWDTSECSLLASFKWSTEPEQIPFPLTFPSPLIISAVLERRWSISHSYMSLLITVDTRPHQTKDLSE